MLLSDISVKRPVLAAVLSLLLVTLGVLSFQRLPLRQLPAIEPPIVSIEVNYPGAAAAVVESRIVRVLEDAIAGLESIQSIQSSSQNGRGSVTLEFGLDRDIDGASNDVRDAVGRVLARLPLEADPPRIQKVDADAQPILWMNLSSSTRNLSELTDYAERFLVDQFSAAAGVARVTIGGDQRYAMRIWLKREQLAARGLTVNDVVAALRRENVELPAGRLESVDRDFLIRITKQYLSPEDFAALPLMQSATGHTVTLGEVADVQLDTAERRTLFRGNGQAQIGLGIVKQSTANTLEVADAVFERQAIIERSLPEDLTIGLNFDSSVFIRSAINEVYFTLGLAVLLVIAVIYLFLGSWRAALIPAVTVPICVMAAFSALDLFGFSINLMTLLALVLSIGLVVDDAIVVLENCQRRLDAGEPPLLAAYRGARQVGFAVVATTAVLVAVFLPIGFMEGDLGRLFRELGVAIASAVVISSVVALSLSPMLCSKLLRPSRHVGLSHLVDRSFRWLERGYHRLLDWCIDRWLVMGTLTLGLVLGSAWLLQELPSELTPPEDQGVFFISFTGPEGAGFDWTVQRAEQIEEVLLRRVESGQIRRMLVRAPRGFGGGGEEMHTGQALVFLPLWDERDESSFDVIDQINAELNQIPGVRASASMRQGFSGWGPLVQFVIGGPDFETLVDWRDRMLERAEAELPGLVGLDADYKETRPQLRVQIDRIRAADLGVSVESIGTTLETMLGSRRVTTFEREGEEYDVILQAQRADRADPSDLTGLYVRSQSSGQLIPLASVVQLEEVAEAGSLARFNRIRAITLTAQLAQGYSLGQALEDLTNLARDELPGEAQIDYKGQSRDYYRSGSAVLVTFALALLVVFLVLSAQFESFIHPLVIMLAVPLAVFGALGALFLAGSTINIYSQIGVIMLVGLATKNGVLIVEFANQQRDAGLSVRDAILESARVRLRPIVMTSLSTIMGAMPLVLASGAGKESRITIGIAVAGGMAFATLVTLFVVPAFYRRLAGFTRAPDAVAQDLVQLEQREKVLVAN